MSKHLLSVSILVFTASTSLRVLGLSSLVPPETDSGMSPLAMHQSDTGWIQSLIVVTKFERELQITLAAIDVSEAEHPEGNDPCDLSSLFGSHVFIVYVHII